MCYFKRKVCRNAQQCVFTNHIVRKVFMRLNLREGLKWKAHSPTKEVRGLAMESLTKGGTTNGHAIINLKIALFLAMTQNSGNSSGANRLAFCLPCKKQNSGYPSEANRLAFCLPCKKQNSGNQPEFQSSIKKRTVNQTVCYFYKSKILKSTC